MSATILMLNDYRKGKTNKPVPLQKGNFEYACTDCGGRLFRISEHGIFCAVCEKVKLIFHYSEDTEEEPDNA